MEIFVESKREQYRILWRTLDGLFLFHFPYAIALSQGEGTINIFEGQTP